MSLDLCDERKAAENVPFPEAEYYQPNMKQR
jgi:hypothetical protein